MNVLFLALEFAPIHTTGCHRSIKFVKYLPEFGCNPIVLTVDVEEGARYFRARIDRRLERDIPPDVPIYRFTINWNRCFERSPVLNALRVWLSFQEHLGQLPKQVMARLDEIIGKHSPEALYVSLPPFAAGDLALAIAHRYALPLIVDMRDAWAQWESSPFTTRLHFEIVRHKEFRLLQSATEVVTVSPQLAKLFENDNNLPQDSVLVFPNGYDGDISQPEVRLAPAIELDKIRITYVGSFYYKPEYCKKPWYLTRPNRWLHYKLGNEDWRYRSPYYFLRTLQEVLQRNEMLARKVTFTYVGNAPAWLPEMVDSFGLMGHFENRGFIPKQDLESILATSQAFLATSEKRIGGEHYALPSKLFDYLPYEAPVFGFVTAGTQRVFLRESGKGVILDPDSPDTATRLEQVLTEGVYQRINKEYMERYHRKYTASSMAQLLRSL